MPDDEPKKTDASPDEADRPPNDEPPERAAGGPAEDQVPARGHRRARRHHGRGDRHRPHRARGGEEAPRAQKRRRARRASQAAASKRLAKIGEVKVKRPSAASDAVSPEADPLLERAARLSKWIKEHRQTFGGVVAVALLGVGGFLGYTYWQGKHEADASAILGAGVRRRARPRVGQERRRRRRRARSARSTRRSRPSARGGTRRSRKYREVRDEVRGHRARPSSRVWPRRASCSTRATPRARRRPTRR